MPSVDQSMPFSANDFCRDQLAVILHRIIDHYGERLVSLIVFGSYARQKPRLNSDLDMLIILNSGSQMRLPDRTKEFVAHIEEPCDKHLQALFEEGISLELSPIILTRDEAQNFLPLYLDMVSNSLIIKDREGFFEGVLEKVKRQMDRWGSKRTDMSGHWVWDICPGLKWNEVLDYDK